MTLQSIIRRTLTANGLEPTDVSRAPAGGAVAWFERDDGETLTSAVQTVERETLLTYQGESDVDASWVGLRFDWDAGVPRHRVSVYNPRGRALNRYAEAMRLSRAEARRAVTGLHHDASVTWKGDRQTVPVIRYSPGVLPESETGMHRYHYYVE